MVNDNIDLVRRAIKDLVEGTIIPIMKLGELSDIIKGYNVSTFLTTQASTRLLTALSTNATNQDALFDTLVEFKYRLLAVGLKDADINILVLNSLDTIYKSNVLPADYSKNVAFIPDSNKTDSLLQLLYLLRVNIVYFDDMLISKKNKEKSK